MNLERTISLIGEEKLNIIRSKKILIVGIGGVGGYALESLVRMGINNITIVDFDTISETNINRQILSTNENIDCYKVDEALKRYKSINEDLNLITIKDKLTESNLDSILETNYDFIIDACDDTKVKVALVKFASKNAIKIISSMGTAKRIDASKVTITRLDKTNNDPLAKKMRSLLRKENISLKIPVVTSTELPIKTGILGSVSYVPGVAGLLITSYVINEFLK